MKANGQFFTPEKFNEIVQKSKSLLDVARYLGYSVDIYPNARTMQRIKDNCKKCDIDISHFQQQRTKELQIKICPVCNKKFEVISSQKKANQQTTCSRSCANTFFKSGVNHGSFHENSIAAYKILCWENHKKECIICGEKGIVAVHHYDGNHDNNDPDNLIPLCPTHHVYAHTKRLIPLIQSKMDAFRSTVL